MQINFSEIPGFSNLFLDYLYEFDNCKLFFKKYFRDADKYEEQFQNRITPDDTLRVKLRAIITDQYSSRNPSKLTIQNINSLENENTIVILTEVNPFLFGGPLSAIYKIISAIKLSQKLKEDFDGYNFIPLLWIESENAELDEITNISFTNRNDSFSTIRFNIDNEEAINEVSTGSIKFGNEISELVEKLINLLPQTDSTEELTKRLLKTYRKGENFITAFSEYVYKLFDEYGIVIFNPSDKKVKNLLAPIFRQELINFREHAEKLVETTAELDEFYSADEKLVPLNLYLTVDDRRLLIEPVNNEFRLHTKRKRISEEEILSIIKNEPGKISPSSLLLPICQNYLFQTGFTISDSFEISRLAQSEKLYDFFEIEPPFIFPAISATLLDEHISTYLKQNELSLQTVFIDGIEPEGSAIENNSNILDELFNKAKVDIAEILAGLEEQLNLTDNESGDEIRNAAKEMSQLLETLRDRIKDSQQEKAHNKNIRFEQIKSLVFPEGILQERIISSLSCVNKYGDDFIKILFNKLSVTKTDHQIIEI